MPTSYGIDAPTDWLPIGERNGVLVVVEQEPAYRTPQLEGLLEIDLDARTQAPMRPAGLGSQALAGLMPGIAWYTTPTPGEPPGYLWLPPASEAEARALWTAEDVPDDAPGTTTVIGIAQ